MKDGSKGRAGQEISRRELLELGATAAAAAAAATLAGCDDDGAPGDGDGDALGADAAPAADAPVVDPADAAAPPADAAPDPADAAPDPADAATVSMPDAAPGVPTADELLAGIDTFVVLCMENRSYDHYLGARSLVEGLPGDGLTASMKNATAGGLDIYAHELADFTPEDPPHGWDSVHAQWNDGAMDGFVREHAGASQADVMGYHVRSHLPVTWAMADHFVTCDRWFCSVLGPTWPNRFYLHGGSSNGNTGNFPALGFDSVFAQLEAAGISATNYFSDVAWATGGYLKLGGNAGIESFFEHAAAGTLPQFALIDPGFFGGGANDDHPDHDVRLGQALIASVYAALRASPQWNKCLFVLTYDEHGGFFDHVPPPTCVDERAEFRQLGVRVPTLVAGPTVKRGVVDSTVFEHTSVVATLTRRFGLTPLNARVAATADLSGLLDPALHGNPQPGPELPPAPPVSMAKLRARDARLAGKRPTHHTELWDAIERLGLPPHLDRRARSLEIAGRWLDAGARLGAVTLKSE